MNPSIRVYVDHDGQSHFVGRCYYHSRRRSSSFEYAAEWLARDGAFALDPANLPLVQGQFHTKREKSGLPGAIRDSAPDRWGQHLIRRAVLKSGQQQYLSEVDYLLGLNDLTRIGALRYKKADGSVFERDSTGHHVPPLHRLPLLLDAARAVDANTDTARDLRLLLNEGSPLGGARPKSAVLDPDGTLAIAKFPKPDEDRSIPHGEVLALKLAERAGLNVASGRLVDVQGHPVALIRRFDRCGTRRIPFLSAMSLLGLDDGDSGTYVDIALCIRRFARDPKQDLQELWRRIAFGVMIGNLDDHLRNHGFLHAGNNRWRLSPAYDLNPVPQHAKVRELETWISEEGPEAELDLALRAAEHFALTHREAVRIANEVAAAIRAWRTIAREIGMSRSDRDSYATAVLQSPDL